MATPAVPPVGVAHKPEKTALQVAQAEQAKRLWDKFQEDRKIQKWDGVIDRAEQERYRQEALRQMQQRMDDLPPPTIYGGLKNGGPY